MKLNNKVGLVIMSVRFLLKISKSHRAGWTGKFVNESFVNNSWSLYTHRKVPSVPDGLTQSFLETGIYFQGKSDHFLAFVNELPTVHSPSLSHNDPKCSPTSVHQKVMYNDRPTIYVRFHC